MRALTRLPRAAGFTLVELIIAITVAGFVMTALYQVLKRNQRFSQAQTQIVDVQQNIRAIALILPGELRELDASDGDVIAMDGSSITVRAMRGLSITCAAPNPTTGQVIVSNAMTWGYRAVDPARDQALMFREGNPQNRGDDVWLRSAVGATAAATCADGSAGTRLTLSTLAGVAGLGGMSALGSGDVGATTGAPVRTFETVRYLLYADGTGISWLGVQTFSGGSWSASSPIAGPLVAGSGISFEYRDAAGNTTTDVAQVARIGIVIRGVSVQPVNIPNHVGYYQDSLTTRVSLRNNVRP